MIVVFFCIKREIAGVRTIIPHGIFFLYSQFNAYDRVYQAYEIVLKCVMLSNAMIEKFIEHTLVSTVHEDEIEICIPKEKRAEFESWRSTSGV